MSCQICRDDIWADFESVICHLIFPPYTYWPLRASVKMTDTLPDVIGCMECNCRPNVGEKPRLSIILRHRSESFRQGVEIMLFSLSSKNFVSCFWLYPLKMWWLGITAIFPQVSAFLQWENDDALIMLCLQHPHTHRLFFITDMQLFLPKNLVDVWEEAL